MNTINLNPTKMIVTNEMIYSELVQRKILDESRDLFYRVEFNHGHKFYHLESFNKILKETNSEVIKMLVTLITDDEVTIRTTIEKK